LKRFHENRSSQIPGQNCDHDYARFWHLLTWLIMT